MFDACTANLFHMTREHNGEKKKKKKYQKVAKLEFTQAEFMSQTVSPEYKVSSEKCLSGATGF